MKLNTMTLVKQGFKHDETPLNTIIQATCMVEI